MFVIGGRLFNNFDSGTVNSFLTFAEVSIWHIKVMFVYSLYLVCQNVLETFPCSRSLCSKGFTTTLDCDTFEESTFPRSLVLVLCESCNMIETNR